MNVSEMIRNLTAILAEQGDVEVMFVDFDDAVRSVSYCSTRVAEQDEFPDEWDMPEGFTFVEIGQ